MPNTGERQREELPEIKRFPPGTTILVLERDPEILEFVGILFLWEAKAKDVINCPDYSKVESAIKGIFPSAIVADTLTLADVSQPADLVRENKAQPKVKDLLERLKTIRTKCPGISIILTGANRKELETISEEVEKSGIGPVAWFSKPFEDYEAVDIVLGEIEKAARR